MGIYPHSELLFEIYACNDCDFMLLYLALGIVDERVDIVPPQELL